MPNSAFAELAAAAEELAAAEAEAETAADWALLL
jgi:hypothetical protein